MHRTSIYNIRIDFDKSHDSYLYDKNTKREFLDCFGMYAALPLGYSHPIFQSEDFKKDLQRVGRVKVTNCEIISDEAQAFLNKFSSYPPMKNYRYFHFSCTGALAVEAALKTAIDYKQAPSPMILSLKESFHGINSYGGFVTDRWGSSNQRLAGMPEAGWLKLTNPKIVYKGNVVDTELTEKRLNQFKKEFSEAVERYGQRTVALLVEPIQCTAGDQYFPHEFFQTIRELCDCHDICLIVDEVQTGFGTSGKWWYYEYQGIEPDIVVFGKKTQCSGIMVKEKFGRIFSKPVRLEVTWDGDLVDMLRATYIMEAYDQYKILDNVLRRGEEFRKGLQKVESFQNVRQTGLLIAFDLADTVSRDLLVEKLYEKGMLCNRTQTHTIRLRPNLNISKQEVDKALEILQSCAVNAVSAAISA